MGILSKLLAINVFKTLRFNFHYFPFLTAIKLPALVFRNVDFEQWGGVIFLPKNVKTGMLKIGGRSVSIFPKNCHSVWDVNGSLILKGNCSLGSGFSLSVAKNATLELGNYFKMTAHSTIDCSKRISFGDNCLLSWDILIMDSDYHKILDEDDNQINHDSIITIGNQVWIGCRSTILKGVSLKENTIVAAGSLLTKSCDKSKCIIAGQGKDTRIIKERIKWIV